jgi:hypothetical protein
LGFRIQLIDNCPAATCRARTGAPPIRLSAAAIRPNRAAVPASDTVAGPGCASVVALTGRLRGRPGLRFAGAAGAAGVLRGRPGLRRGAGAAAVASLVVLVVASPGGRSGFAGAVVVLVISIF